MNKKLLIGVLFIAIALCFGVYSTCYEIGTFDNAGPGLYPLTVSAVLAVIGVLSIVTGKLETRDPVEFKFKNIALVVAGLVAFAVTTTYFGMSIGIIALVAITSIAADRSSVKSTVAIIVSLLTIAFAFKYLLGMPLPL
jgi:hypothetical protein